MKEAANDLFI